MTSQTNRFMDEARKALQESPLGDQIVADSEAGAASFLFDLQAGELNADVSRALTPAQIYHGVALCNSLTFTVDDQEYHVEPYFAVDEENALAILQDTQTRLEVAMLDAILASRLETPSEPTDGTTGLLLDVNLTDVVAPYEDPKRVPEWQWIREKACFAHTDNGQSPGVYEFIVHASVDRTNMPSTLQPYFERAQKEGEGYILFNQG